MAKITIGGVEYTIPEMNFLAIERAWPYVVEATESQDPMKGPSAALGVFASAIMEAEDFDPTVFGLRGKPELGDTLATPLSDEEIHKGVTHFFKKKLKGVELSRVKDTMLQVLKEAGLEVTEGELTKSPLEALQEAITDLPETAPPTSQSLSPPASREEAGTPSESDGDLADTTSCLTGGSSMDPPSTLPLPPT
jgi:hypothetical protein